MYSLGVLLYELLTGTTPFDKETLQKSGFDEMRRIIREVDPPRPSARLSSLSLAKPPGTGSFSEVGEGKGACPPLRNKNVPVPFSEAGLRQSPLQETAHLASTIAEHRRSDPRQLTKLCQGELDWIVMKSLEKDRNRRYETASSLAVDVEHYLADEPVQACPPSKTYRFRKFVQRKKSALAIATVLGLMLLSVVAVVAASVGWIARARDEGRDAVRLADAHNALGVSLANEGKWSDAEAEYREAIRLTPGRPLLLINLGASLMQQGKRDNAEAACLEAIRAKPDYASSYLFLGSLRRMQHRTIEAVAAFREAIKLSPKDWDGYQGLVTTLMLQGDTDEMESVLRAAARKLRIRPLLAKFSLPFRYHGKHADSASLYRSLLLQKPYNGALHQGLGMALTAQATGTGGQLCEEAFTEFCRALDLLQDNQTCYSPRKKAWLALSQWDNIYERLAALRPEDPTSWLGHAQFHALGRRWNAAAADNAKVIDSRPIADETFEFAGVLSLTDQHRYREFCQDLAARYKETRDPDEAIHLARAFAIGQIPVVDPALIVHLAQLAVTKNPAGWKYHVLGLACFRAGDNDSAKVNLEESIGRPWSTPGHEALNWLVLSMIYHQLGEFDTATRYLTDARKQIEELRPEEEWPISPFAIETTDWIELQALLREAEALLKSDAPNPKNEKNDPHATDKTSDADESATSTSGVPHQAGDAVEVGVVTGDVGDPVGLHDGHNQGVVAEKPVLHAQSGSRGNQVGRNREDSNAELRYVGNCLTERIEFLNVSRLPLQSVDNFGIPSVLLRGLVNHQSMRNLAENVGRSEARYLSSVNPLDQAGACAMQSRMGGEVVHQHVGVQKDALAVGQIVECHS